MRLGRSAAAVLVLGAFSASAMAANGSNYVHATNGVDYFFNTAGNGPGSIFNTPGTNAPFGFWNCFNKEMLYSPTLVVNPTDPNVGTYAAKIEGFDVNFTAAAGANITFPLIVLSTGNGTCTFVTSGGLNWGLATGFGNGFLAIVGPTSGSALSIIAAFANIGVANPNLGNGFIYTLALNLNQFVGAPSAVTVKEGHDLTLFVHANPLQTSALPNGWTWSGDEKNICSSHSYMVNTTASGILAFAFVPTVEWGMGVRSIDATLNTYTTSLGAGASGLNANAAFGIDNGSGAQTLSITGSYPNVGGALGSDVLGFLTYDTTHPTGSGRYVLGSVTGFRTCFNTALVLGGPGGPVFSNAIPQAPRLVGTFDALTNALAGLGPTWLLIAGHDTVPGAVNIPWFPTPSVGPAGATGVTGGFAVTVPPFPTLPGIELLWYSTPLFLSASVIPGNFLDPLVNNGHSNSLSYPLQFHP